MGHMDKARPAHWVALGAFAVFLAASNAIWLIRDTRPQHWDESIHLTAAEKFRQAGLAGSLAKFASVDRYYPPLVPLYGSMAARVLPNSEDGYTFALLGFHLLLVTCVFLLAAEAAGANAGLAAAIIAGTAPFIVNEGHYFMLDVPLTALVTLCALLLSRPGAFVWLPFSVLIGLCAGAGMLVKWTFPVYILAPALFAVAAAARVSGWKRAALAVVVAAAVAKLVCLPWYGPNLIFALKTGLSAAYHGLDTEGQKILSAGSLIYYFRTMPANLGWPGTILLAAGVILLARNRGRRRHLWNITVPFLILLLLRNKKDRYLMPVLPFLSVACAFTLSRIRPEWLRKTAVPAVIAACLFGCFAATSPSIKWWPRNIRPMAEDWKIGEIMADLSARAKGPAAVCVLANHQSFNAFNTGFAALRTESGLKVVDAAQFPVDCRFVLLKTGDNGPGFAESARAVAIARELESGREYGALYRKLKEYPLPDGSRAVGYDVRPGLTDANAVAESMASMLSPIFSGISVRATPARGGKGLFDMSLELRRGWLRAAVGGKPVALGPMDMRIRLTGVKMGVLEEEPVLLALDEIRVEQFELSASAATNTLLKYGDSLRTKELGVVSPFVRYFLTKLENPRIEFKDGHIIISGSLRKMPWKTRLSLCKDTEGTIRLGVDGASFAGIPLLGVSWAIGDYNWLLNPDSPLVRKIRFDSISLENDLIHVTSN